jgi:predicted membrane protein
MKQPHDRKKELETLLVLAIATLVFHVVLHIELLIYVALGLLIIGLIFKRLASRITKVWLKLAHSLGTFNSKVLLTIVFYLVLTPIAIVYKLFTKNPLRLKRDVSLESYYVSREHSFSKEDFEKMW